mgnify:CR=1 FL=1
MNFAFVFPGQGSQSVGMMAAYGESAVIRQAFAEAYVDALRRHFGWLKDWYQFAASGLGRSPLVERALVWLEANFPKALAADPAAHPVAGTTVEAVPARSDAPFTEAEGALILVKVGHLGATFLAP